MQEYRVPTTGRTLGPTAKAVVKAFLGQSTGQKNAAPHGKEGGMKCLGEDLAANHVFLGREESKEQRLWREEVGP